MPDYSFFLSYSSKDRIATGRDAEATNPRDLVRVFFDDLHAEMRVLGYDDGGFFDKLRLEAKWETELELGLASSRILVPLYSPTYFQSNYCGKEWETFNQRFDENERHRYGDVTSSKVILPVCWTAPVVLPATVDTYQIDYENYDPAYRNGLVYLMSRDRYKEAYQDFLFTFSRKLLALAQGQGDAKVRDVLSFDSLNPPFPWINRPGLKFVRYVFVAGMKHEMSNLRQSNDSYAHRQDRKDWRPCFPDLDRAVEGIVTGPATADNRTFEILAPSPRLMDRLREAKRLNNVILVMVDPWSVKLPDLRQFLLDFDAEDFPNSAVLVNWNGKDPETSAESARLQELLQDHFRGRRARREFHKDPVSSVESIERAVVEAFGAIQARLIEMGKIRPAVEGDPGQAPVLRN